MAGEPENPFESFREAVLADEAAVARLLATRGQAELVAEALAIAAEKGLRLEEADLTSAQNAARRAHLERWLP